MTLDARLKRGESLGDRVIKIDHAGEHGAVNIYRAQRWVSRWRMPDMLPQLSEFIAHEQEHRAMFGRELVARARPRCRSYHLCGAGGLLLGFVTGLIGRRAVATTTVAIERVVLRHLEEQVAALADCDAAAVSLIGRIVRDEQSHHDLALEQVPVRTWWTSTIDRVVEMSTEVVIWSGMRL